MKKRIARVNSLLKKELSQFLLEKFNLPAQVLMTITRVETSLDLRQAKVFVSIFPKEKSQEVLQSLKEKNYQIQKIFNKRIKMKFVPKISFLEEKMTAEAGRVEEILEKLKREKGL